MSVRIHFAPGNTTVQAGEVLRGTLILGLLRPGSLQAIHLRWRLRAGAQAHGSLVLPQSPLQPPPQLRNLAAGHHRLPFEVRAPRPPPSGAAGRLLDIEWTLEAITSSGWGRQATTETAVKVLEATQPVTSEDREALRRAHQQSQGLIGRVLDVVVHVLTFANALFIPGVILTALFLKGSWLTGSLLLAIPALLFLAWLTGRWAWNRIAERRLGKVFTGLPATVSVREELRLGVCFTPPTPVEPRVTATLVGEESIRTMSVTHSSSRGTRSRVTTQRAKFTEQEILFRFDEQRGLYAGILGLDRLELPPSLDLGALGKICYWVEVRIEIPNWPDWVHRYPLTLERQAPQAPLQLELIPAQRGQAQCPYCRDSIVGLSRDELLQCGDCKTVFHAECIHELRRCTTRGCSRNQAPRQRARG